MKLPAPRPNRIASLDGLRAVSILLVVFFHIAGPGPYHGAFASLGNLGVRIFFVISGYIITMLLLRELRGTSSIDLKRFYFRRVLRIFPAFYSYLGALAICAAAGFLAVHRFDLLEASTYTINYFPSWRNSVYVRHIWSLAVEEQFYIVWPGILCLLGKRRGLQAAAAFIVIAPFIRLAYWYFVPGFHDAMDRRFETVADALATGCVLAGMQPWLAARRRYNALLRSPLFYAAPALVGLCSIFLAPHPRLYYGVGITVLNIGIAVSIDRWVRFPDGVAGRTLNSTLFRGIGLLSYSIYVWQQPFLDPEGSGVLNRFPLNLIVVAAVSVGSYFLIEQPFQKLKSRFPGNRKTVALAA